MKGLLEPPTPLRGAALLLLAAAWATTSGLAQEGALSPHGELSIACAECHTTQAWSPLADPLAFEHGGTGFELLASHQALACASCHADLRFRRVATACADCHQDVHRGELGLDCASCHDTRGWETARTEMRDRHGATLFPLIGAHRAADCASCHRAPPPRQFAAAPLDCFSCHAADYRAARDPDHARSGFPTACETCHRPTSWTPADFRDHDRFFFPVFSGPHAGVWGSCSDCHRSPGTFASFSCLDCHEHERAEMRDEHDDVNGYTYQSQACLTCHPDGRE